MRVFELTRTLIDIGSVGEITSIDPSLIAFLDTRGRTSPNTLTGLEWVAVVLWCLALAGESLADRQLGRFKADPANRGKVCQVGLWKYSRHPNYFFEWLHWVGWAVIAVASPTGWVGFLVPAFLLLFLCAACTAPQTPAPLPAIDPELAREIAAVKAIDNHAHPVRPVRPGEAPRCRHLTRSRRHAGARRRC